MTNEQQCFLTETYSHLPISFEANQGQTDPQVKFLARGSGYTLFLTPTEIVMTLQKKSEDDQPAGYRHPAAKKQRSVKTSSTVLRVNLVDSNQRPQIEGLEELPGKVNYFIGNDPTKWRTDIPTYTKIKYRGVYPGVDMIYYGNQRQIEYDFVVAPGADPTAIILDFQGIEQMEVDTQGDLVLHTSGEQIRFRKPVVYQEANGEQRKISGGYVIKEQNQAGFQLEDYDTAISLVIDPVLIYSTYLGGDQRSTGFGITADACGNAYVTGATNSLNFPTKNPLQPTLAGATDVFVTKINASGTALVYSTYLGGSGFDLSQGGIAVDSRDNVYITGNTNSPNFPTQNALQLTIAGENDAFVTKINRFGSGLVYSTYLGGSGVDLGFGIAVDSCGNAYVTGDTDSANFPTINALQPTFGGGEFDSFVTKINASGTGLVYSTYLGGSGLDDSGGIAVDSRGNAYVAGGTNSLDFPIRNALQPTFAGGDFDAFVTKINSRGSRLVYSTYLGGSGIDLCQGIAVDLSSNAYLSGGTNSLNFPIKNAVQPVFGGGRSDAFVTKINPRGSRLVYSTYLGGSDNDQAFGGIQVDSRGNACVSGFTNSLDFPTRNAIQSEFGGGPFDAFVTKINARGSRLVYSTYLGGNNLDQSLFKGIAVDSCGNAYVTGVTASLNFPTNNPLQPTFGGGVSDAFVAKISSKP